MSQELLNCSWERWGNVGTVEFTTDGIVLIDNTTGTGTNWIRTSYINLPTNVGKVYQYDFDVSITTGNKIFIQIERFDAQKTNTSNNSAINCVGGVQPSTDLIHQRYRGTINIDDISSTQPTTTIRVRIGCGYQNTTGTLIIHSWSLKPMFSQSGQTLISNPLVQKNGQIIGDNFRENYTNAAFYKDGLIEGQHFYEY